MAEKMACVGLNTVEDLMKISDDENKKKEVVSSLRGLSKAGLQKIIDATNHPIPDSALPDVLQINAANLQRSKYGEN